MCQILFWQILTKEVDYLEKSKNFKREVLCVYLSKVGILKEEEIENIPVISFNSSVGGFFSEIYSIGVIFAMVKLGFYNAISYHTGASGGSWAVVCLLFSFFAGTHKNSKFDQ